MNTDRSPPLMQRLHDDMQRVLGIRHPPRTRSGTARDADPRVWVAGRAGVQPMTRQQFERWL
jgi:hypothetical protein